MGYVELQYMLSINCISHLVKFFLTYKKGPIEVMLIHIHCTCSYSPIGHDEIIENVDACTYFIDGGLGHI